MLVYCLIPNERIRTSGLFTHASYYFQQSIMLRFPDIDPVAIRVGPLQVHWYGVMYLVAFVGTWWMVRHRAQTRPQTRPITPEQVGDLLFYAALGVVLGGRLGYCIFYAPHLFIDFGDGFPWWGLLKVNQGGMSFHGGFVGVMTAFWWYGRQVGATFFQMADFVAPATPFGLLCGRIGNFINGELWGRPTDLPWAMVFPRAGDVPRHPSMLYEALLEGVALWAIRWWYSARPRPRMAVSGLFVLGYGVFRFSVEFVRQPDEQLGFIAFGWVTMGHILTLPMILTGAIMMTIAYRRAR
jgi:phosphatidylglycerol:prolipoprotein diacylglycerol transferase